MFQLLKIDSTSWKLFTLKLMKWKKKWLWSKIPILQLKMRLKINMVTQGRKLWLKKNHLMEIQKVSIHVIIVSSCPSPNKDWKYTRRQSMTKLSVIITPLLTTVKIAISIPFPRKDFIFTWKQIITIRINKLTER